MISRFLIGLTLISVAVSGFAETSMDPVPNLNPVYSDVSVAYLSNIFGVVDGVLHGSGSQILGHMFKMFNSILFTFAGVLWAYTFFVGILNTASQGQFLGQQWSSMWVPFRIVAGAVLLLPKATGYSMIQVIVMYIVLQGVGAANQVWETTLNYLQNTGTIVEFIQPLRSKKGLHDAQQANQVANHEFLIDEAGKILKAEVAMLTLYNAREKQGRSLGLSPLPHFAQTLHTETYEDGFKILLPGPLYGGNAIKGSCGQIQWQDNQKERLISRGVELMQQSLLPVAQAMANQIVLIPPMNGSVVRPPTTNNEVQGTQNAQSNENQVTVITSTPLRNLLLSYAGALINATNNGWAFIKPALRQQQNKDKQQSKDQFEQMKAQGWILAGSYYYQLAKFNQNHHDNAALIIPANTIRVTVDLGQVRSELDEVTRTAFDACIQAIDQYIDNEKQRALETGYYNPEAPPRTHFSESDWRNSFFRPFQKNIQQFQHQMEATMHAQIDPITALANIGINLIRMVEHTWQEMIDGQNPLQRIITESQKNILFFPLVGTWSTLNFTIGATLFYYIPLMPFLLFFFGSLTWFALVIEAIVAAPLIPLGMTHPEGNSPAGKAEQAMMLLASIFFRPMLMIFGFILGMIFCTIAFNLFHYGYHIAVKAIITMEGHDWVQIVTHTTMMVVYTTTAMTIVNRCFALIYEVPNRALRWMNGPTEGHNDAEGAMQVKGAVESYAGQAGGGFERQSNTPSNAHSDQVRIPR